MSISNVTATPAAIKPTNLHAAGKAYGTEATKSTPATPQPADRVELSKSAEVARLVELTKQDDVRTDKVADLKAQIAAGTYDLDAKAEQVADRILDDLGL
jgi:negative regulator of flagellin synthesis FlgM